MIHHFIDPTPILNSQYGKPNKTVHLSNVNCYGAESSLRDCSAYKKSINNGNGYSVAGISCPPIPYTSPSMSLEPTVAEVSKESSGVSLGALYLLSGIFGVFAVLALLSVVG